MFPGQPETVTFNTGGQSLWGKRYQVRLDPGGLVKESNEGNNETAPAAFSRTRITPSPKEGGGQPLANCNREGDFEYRGSTRNAGKYQRGCFTA